jgi:hypothetical protein
MYLTVLEVNVRDAAVILPQEGNRRGVVPGDEVADIEIDAVALGIAHGRFPTL